MCYKLIVHWRWYAMGILWWWHQLCSCSPQMLRSFIIIGDVRVVLLLANHYCSYHCVLAPFCKCCPPDMKLLQQTAIVCIH